MTHYRIISETHRNNLVLGAVCIAALMFGLEISSIPVILPTLETVLGATFKDMQWIMNAYTIACTTVLMATGTLADRFGRKQVFALATIGFAGTSLMCGLAPSAFLLIIMRFLQGIAGGAMFTCTIAVLSHQFQTVSARARAFAIWGVTTGIGLGFGPIIGGLIIALSTWQWVFLVHVPLAALALVSTFAGMTESRDPQAKQLDLLGIATLSTAVFGLAYYITQGADLGFASPTALAIIAGTLASFITFIVAELFAAHPMFDFSVFKARNFTGAIIGCVGMNFSYWPFMIYLPIYFTTGLGYDSEVTGLLLLAYTMPFLVMTPIAQYLLLHYHARRVIPLGLFTIGLGFILMRLGIGMEDPSWLTLLPGALIAGIGIGLTSTPVTDTTTGSVSADRSGMASGIDTSARLIALAINIAVMGFVLMEGVLANLKSVLPNLDAAQLRLLVERIAAGNAVSAAELSDAVIHQALTNGFRWVMLYGGIGVWIMASISFLIFNAQAFHQAKLRCSD